MGSDFHGRPRDKTKQTNLNVNPTNSTFPSTTSAEIRSWLFGSVDWTPLLMRDSKSHLTSRADVAVSWPWLLGRWLWISVKTALWSWVLSRPASTSTDVRMCRWCVWLPGSSSAPPPPVPSMPWHPRARCFYLGIQRSPWRLSTHSIPPWRTTWPVWAWLWSPTHGTNLCCWVARASWDQTPLVTVCCPLLSSTCWWCPSRWRETRARYPAGYRCGIRQRWMRKRGGFRSGRKRWWRPNLISKWFPVRSRLTHVLLLWALVVKIFTILKKKSDTFSTNSKFVLTFHN